MKENKQFFRINEQIKVKEVRLVDENGSKVVKTSEALQMAKDQELDLVEINSQPNPSICKIIDYSKFLYQQKKKEKEQKQKQKQAAQEVKEIKFGPNTDEHDYQFKKNHAKNFLENGNKVRAYVWFKGREIMYKDKGEAMLLRLANDLEEIGKVEKLPVLEGKKMTIILLPKKKKG